MSTVIPEPKASSNLYLDRITLVQGDITQQNVDAIVTLLPQNLECKGLINEAICQASGRDLQAFVKEHISRPVAGDVYALPGFDLPCKYVFFCIVPPWRTDFDREDKYLIQACRKAIETAAAMNLKSIAFPPLASGKLGFPKAKAARLILKGIEDRLGAAPEEVRIVCQSPETVGIFQERLRNYSVTPVMSDAKRSEY